jgi:hypothetical protein
VKVFAWNIGIGVISKLEPLESFPRTIYHNRCTGYKFWNNLPNYSQLGSNLTVNPRIGVLVDVEYVHYFVDGEYTHSVIPAARACHPTEGPPFELFPAVMCYGDESYAVQLMMTPKTRPALPTMLVVK